jgi:ribokinase
MTAPGRRPRKPGPALKCLTVGGAMVDTIAIVESHRIERMSMRNADTAFLLLEEGRKTEAEDVSTHCGGGAVNAAVALSRLGFDVAALVKLGRDQRAESVLNRLTAEGVSTRWAMRDERAPTGASVMLAAHDRNAAIFTFRGANTLLEPSDLREDAFAVDLVYVSSLSNKSADCFPEIVRKAKAAGALVAANPGIRQLSARGGALLDSLPYVDILLLNRSESDALVPALIADAGEAAGTLPIERGVEIPPLLLRGLASGGFEMGLQRFMRTLLGKGVKQLVITDGAGGAYLAIAETLLHAGVSGVEAKSTAGAGDGFGATFAGFALCGENAETCLAAAAINAAAVISQIDTQSGLLSLETLRTRLRNKARAVALQSWTL